MRSKTLSLVSLVLMVGCGSNLPPKELVDARAAYQLAAKGPAAQQSPAELHVAKQALDQAERSFNDEGDAPATKDFSYIAMRKAELAAASARAALAVKDKEAAERDAANLTQDALARARGELASTKNNLEKTQGDLEREKRAREEAEKKAALALADLRRLADVKQESRGMVITLSGSVLFATNESTLLPAAILKLNDVADALIKGNPDANITVEGHTDSQGQRQYNMDLSQKRADAVRDQLVARGVAADRIKTVGIGPDRPIADNKSAEGRANNRRVEIIVQPAKK
ncbi:MAG TPA: OmpA family protein [Labilithrix sp.]|jgi:outer membrane protein OmpA-like peptidoglycan-associated protein